MRYSLQYHPNTNIVTVHINSRITDEMIVSFEGSHVQGRPGQVEMPEYVKNIFAVAGIEAITLYQHRISFTKGSMFSWSEILPLIVFAMNSEFDPQGEAVEMPTTDGLGEINEEPKKSAEKSDDIRK